MSLQIHWHEGLFLQPHHLQRFQKNLFDLVGEQRGLIWPFPYGVVEARLSTDELENKRIRFDRLRAVMPSGVEIDYPRNADLPSIDIKQSFVTQPAGFTIYLALPLWVEQRANTLDPERSVDARAKLIYRVNEVEYADENSGENPKPMLVRRLNGRLLLEREDDSDLEKIPLLRITRSVTEESEVPRQDPDFVPPSLVINGSPVLRELVRDLSAQVEASRKELVVQVTRGGFSIDTMRGLQFEQLTRLRTLNRFAARLPSLVKAPAITPFQWYLELRELHAELVALHPDRDDFNVLDYNHDNPVLCFRELSAKIREFIRGTLAPSFIKVDFRPEGDLLAAAFTAEHFSRPTDYLLGVRTKEDPRGMAAFVEDGDKFKLMPRSAAGRAFFGMPIKEERHPPLELPAQADLHYFRLDRTNGRRHWEAIQAEKAAVIRWIGKEDADYQIALYMIVPADAH